MPRSMRSLRTFLSECETLDVAAFCTLHPYPFLVHSTLRQRELQPHSDPPKPTVDRLVVENDANENGRVTALEDCYHAIELRPSTGSDRITLGRDDDCDIAINDVSVSRVHAYIEHANGAFSIVDTDSTAGTQVNDQLLAGGQRVVLAPRDRISLGYVSLVFTRAEDFHSFVRSLFGL